MLGTFALILAVTATPDPRPELVELQLAGQHRQALARVEQELADRPEPSRKLGLDYLHGHLLDTLGRFEGATTAFLRTLTATPPLKHHAYYRLAHDYDLLGHPEMATGLVANTVAEAPSSPLLPEAVQLLARTITQGETASTCAACGRRPCRRRSGGGAHTPRGNGPLRPGFPRSRGGP